MLNFKIVAIGATLAIATIGAFAQTSAIVPATTTATPKIDTREATQQTRIDNGVKSGQLTAKETNHLDKQQAHVASAEAKAKSDGTMTKKERHHLTKMQNKASNDINAQKHDAQVAPKP